MRLDKLEMVFGSKTSGSGRRGGALMVKIAERRATLLGLNPPLGHAVTVVQHEPVTKRTSTEEARARLDAFMGSIASAS